MDYSDVAKVTEGQLSSQYHKMISSDEDNTYMCYMSKIQGV